MLGSALVPCDFTADFGYVAKFAEGLSGLGVSRVVLGHVVEAGGLEGPVIAAKVDRARDKVRDLAAPLVAAGLDVEVRVATGTDPARELLCLASESNVDLVVLGSHAKEGFTKLIERPISEEVVWHAEVPVLLVRFELLRNAQDPAALALSFGRTLLLGTDFSESAERAFATVISMPARSVGTMFLMHVIDSALPAQRQNEAEVIADARLREMVARAAERGVTARPVIRRGDPVPAMLQEANERRATGIVVGTRGPNPLADVFLGSLSLTLLRQASCPVMIIS